jgi:acylphosphatase
MIVLTSFSKEEEMLQMRLIVTGSVQQVGFRYGVVTYVESCGQDIRGFVRNLPDGSVEIVAQGHIEALKSLHRYATKGPPKASVRSVEQEIKELEHYTFEAFEMLR